mmetsp:Transcript_30998/g.40931  ORF Transcript_30998/g.40931 Transcript_30998/m.40931 type:complete len:430 (+) Transcript_30998:74-1363(+)
MKFISDLFKGFWSSLFGNSIFHSIWKIFNSIPLRSLPFQPEQKEDVRLFRITGEASIRRITPVLLKTGKAKAIVWKEAKDQNEKIDFVWETTVSMIWKDAHREAAVLNRLHNSYILEDKGNMALLQQRMKCQTLETYIMPDRCSVAHWVRKRWASGVEKISTIEFDWWMVKASKGNGGADIWVLHQDNYNEVLDKIAEDEELVVQKYIKDPLLYKGRKFHFRCYTLLSSNMQPYFYEMAYILAATEQYRLQDPSNELIHISNMAVNKHMEGYPGQIPCHLPKEYPEVFEAMKQVYAELVAAASPFLSIQQNPNYFEYFGLDFMADNTGKAWLIEVNRLPGLQSSKSNKEQEDAMYDKMIEDILSIYIYDSTLQKSPKDSYQPQENLWQKVKKPDIQVSFDSRNTWKNLFNFKAYVRKAKKKCFYSQTTK